MPNTRSKEVRMRRLVKFAAITLTTMTLAFSSNAIHLNRQPVVKSVTIVDEPIVYPKTCTESIDEPWPLMVVADIPENPPEYGLSDEEIELIALVTMAEAEGESEEGKRLVIDTILNRVDHEEFPDSVEDVVYQRNQFTSMWNGRVDRCYVDEDICNLVREELLQRTNYEVVFFMANKYGKYGKPLLVEGNHYFSSYA